MQLLVVDDNPEIRILMKSFFKRKGFEVDVASSGKEASEVLKSKTYDYIISDVQMNDGDGLELTKAQRSLGNKAPIFLMSGELTMTTEIAKSYGATEFFAKPVNCKTILKAILDRQQSAAVS